MYFYVEDCTGPFIIYVRNKIKISEPSFCEYATVHFGT